MSTVEVRIAAFLATIKAEGRSSPAGMHWQKFHDLLVTHRQSGHGEPPRPLILAAASESDATKHYRLAKQLEWAGTNQCLDAALAFLDDLPRENWNTSSREHWQKDSY